MYILGSVSIFAMFPYDCSGSHHVQSHFSGSVPRCRRPFNVNTTSVGALSNSSITRTRPKSMAFTSTESIWTTPKWLEKIMGNPYTNGIAFKKKCLWEPCPAHWSRGLWLICLATLPFQKLLLTVNNILARKTAQKQTQGWCLWAFPSLPPSKHPALSTKTPAGSRRKKPHHSGDWGQGSKIPLWYHDEAEYIHLRYIHVGYSKMQLLCRSTGPGRLLGWCPWMSMFSC